MRGFDDIGHALMENRNGLAVDGGITQASGTAEQEATLTMLAPDEPPHPHHARRRQACPEHRRCGL